MDIRRLSVSWPMIFIPTARGTPAVSGFRLSQALTHKLRRDDGGRKIADVLDLAGRDIVDETTPFLEAGDTYGESKAAAERVVWAAAAEGLRATVLRPPAILGAHPGCYWTIRMPQQIASGEFSLHGDGGYALPYVHVENLANALVLAARSDRSIGQAYIVLDGHTTWRELTDLFLSWLGLPAVPSVSPMTVPPAYRWHGRWSGDKIRRDLGYAPRVTFREAMAEAKTYLVETGVLQGQGDPDTIPSGGGR